MNKCAMLLALVAFALTFQSCGKSVEFTGNTSRSQELLLRTSQKFVASKIVPHSVVYDAKINKLSKVIDLRALEPTKIQLRQIERKWITQKYVQGSQGDLAREDFSTKTPDKLDLLIVIDDSSSMGPYQNRLSPQLSPLLSHIGNTDWQIKVISTTPMRRPSRIPGRIQEIYGCSRRNPRDLNDHAILTKAQFEQDPIKTAERFKWKVSIGDDTGDPIERGLLAAVEGLKGECGDAATPWTRLGSHKAVLILTDEENCGSDPDQGCDDKADSSASFFIQNAPQGTQFFALLHDKDRYSETCSDEGYIRKPSDYREAIALTGGFEGNICSTDYKGILTEISKNIKQVHKSQYQLKPSLKRSDVKLLVDGVESELKFRIEDDNLILEEALPPNAERLSLAYYANKVPKFRALNLSENIEPETLVVKINDTRLDSSQFKIGADGVNKKLEFSEEPADRATIQLSSRDPRESLPKAFSTQIPHSEAGFGHFQVFLGGIETRDFEYDSFTGKLSFSSPPQDGVEIDLHYEQLSTRQTHYDIEQTSGNKVLSVTFKDLATSEEILGSLESGQVVFPVEAVRRGRQVMVEIQSAPVTGVFKLVLPQEPILDQLKITSDLESGQDCIHKVQIQTPILVFPCHEAELGKLKIDYKYLSDPSRRYKLPKKLEPGDRVQVLKDGKLEKDIVVTKDSVEVSGQQLHTDSTVEVIIDSRKDYELE